ncbi:MAG: 4Fe-4S binding protein [Deltaproteobacteria bacterium]|nr:4Fe-4S binding protein [Deltaproteobacteria bacterium]
MEIHIDKEICTGCGVCVEACPADAIHMEEGLAVVSHEICDLDGICIPACPVEAISLQD